MGGRLQWRTTYTTNTAKMCPFFADRAGEGLIFVACGLCTCGFHLKKKSQRKERLLWLGFQPTRLFCRPFFICADIFVAFVFASDFFSVCSTADFACYIRAIQKSCTAYKVHTYIAQWTVNLWATFCIRRNSSAFSWKIVLTAELNTSFFVEMNMTMGQL